MTRELYDARAAYIAENQGRFFTRGGDEIFGLKIVPFEALWSFMKKREQRCITGFTRDGDAPVWKASGFYCFDDMPCGMDLMVQQTDESFKPYSEYKNNPTAKELCESQRLFLRIVDSIIKEGYYSRIDFIQIIPLTENYIGYRQPYFEGSNQLGFECDRDSLFVRETTTELVPFNPPA